jgi:uncharacterized protein
MRFAPFFLMLLTVLALVNFYVHRRVSRAFSLTKRARRGLALALLGAGLAMALSRVLGRTWPGAPVAALGVVGSAVEVAVLMTAFLLGLVDLARAAVFAVERLAARLRRRHDQAHEQPVAARGEAAPAPAAPADEAAAAPPAGEEATVLPRRAFVAQAAAGSALLVGASSAGYGAIFGRRDYIVEEVVVPIPGLPPELEGFTLVQLSDVHLGQYVGEREVAAASSLVRDARPDMVVLTGDLIDHDAHYADLLGAFARRVGEKARHGVVSVPGNHDHYAGIDETNEALRRAGARVLVNEGMVVGDRRAGFALLGVDDVWSARRGRGRGADLARAISQVPPEMPRVLLCHNPVFFPDASSAVALQLSGHTHGGQVNLIVRPADVVLPFGYVAGLYERDGARLYVNRGFGTAGPPLRVGSPPEVTRVVLVGA